MKTWRRLRSELYDYNLERIMMWHYRRYFTHLEYDDVVALAGSWVAEKANEAKGWTLAEANRSASSALYALSRSLGWRKLTAQEREKFGMSQQWVRADSIPARQYVEDFPGIGEATVKASRGVDWGEDE